MDRNDLLNYLFAALFLLVSILVVAFDVKEAGFLHFSVEEKVFLPALGIIIFGAWAFTAKNRLFGPTKTTKELSSMSFASKALLFFTALFFLMGLLLAVFEGISFIEDLPGLVSEERALGIAMLVSGMLFILNYGREIRA